MSRQNLRNLPRISYYEPEEPSLDEYVFCRDCRDYVYEYCSIHGPLLVVPDSKVPSKTNFPSQVPRAALTIPSVFLHLAPSSIPGAGIGVFSTLTLPAGVRFGPYRGKITKEIDSVYCWQIYDKDNKPIHVVDAADAERSNWMRYVNCSRHWCEQNLLAYQYKGQVYYRTIRIIPRFTELLVFYGSEFANILNVDLRLYNTPQQIYYENLCKVQSEKQLQNNTQVKDKDYNNNGETKEIHIKSKRKLEKTKKSFMTKKQKSQQPINKKVNAEEVVNSKRKPKETKTNVPKKEKNQKPINNEGTQKENMNGAKTSAINTTTKEFKCNECDKQFSTKDILTDHILKCIKTTETFVSNNKPTKANTLKYFQSEIYSCDICTFKTYYKRSLETHLKMHVVNKVFTCNICEYRCAQKGVLKLHVRTHTGEKPFSCNICEYSCAQKIHLKRHIRTHTGEKPFSCNICEYRCAQKAVLKLHVRTHTGEKPFSCNICEYRCAQKGVLKLHIRTHTGEKPFSCNICEYSCAQKIHLKRHIRTHTGEKPFSCNICEYRCAQKAVLKLHVRTHTGEKPFSCNICEYRCAQKGVLKLHIRTHTGEKPFSCNICEYRCAQKGVLKLHVRTHTGEKPFSCNICEYSCAQKIHLKRHIRTHTGEKPFSCNICEYRCTLKSNFKSHLRTHN